MHIDPQGEDCPLCVDLDGTLIYTDTLLECLVDVARQRPLKLLWVPFWILQGRSVLKQQLAKHCDFDPVSLPYRHDLLDDLRAARRSGRKLMLVTAADTRIANGIADHLRLFETVLASDGTTNLKGPAKARALEAEFGARRFDYVGDSTADLAVWRVARRAWVAGSQALVERVGQQGFEVERSYVDQHVSVWKSLLQALRPHQWVKNLLVFVPLVAAHRFTRGANWRDAGLMFVAFSLAASAGYLINDLLDVRNDRQHHSKNRRPFASGVLGLQFGLAAPILLSAAILIGWFLPHRCVWILIAYFGMSLLYSTVLKSKPIVDVVLLTCLYCVRIIAGGEATQIMVSVWLLSMSTFIFLSLALAKRSTELRRSANRNLPSMMGRGYSPSDLPILDSMGVVAGYLASMVMMMYLQSTEIQALYRHPRYLWLVLPILLFWVSHIWLTTHRGEMTDDPVVFAITNPTSVLLIGAVGGVAIAAI